MLAFVHTIHEIDKQKDESSEDEEDSYSSEEEEEEDNDTLPMINDDDRDKDSPVVVKQPAPKWRRKNILLEEDDASTEEYDNDNEAVEIIEDSQFKLRAIIVGQNRISWITLLQQMFPKCTVDQLVSFRLRIRRRLLNEDCKRDGNDFKDQVTMENLKIILEDILKHKGKFKEVARSFLHTEYPTLVKYMKKKKI